MEGARRSCLSRDLKHKEAHVSMDRGQEGTCGQRTSHRSMPRRSFFFHLFFFPFCNYHGFVYQEI